MIPNTASACSSSLVTADWTPGKQSMCSRSGTDWIIPLTGATAALHSVHSMHSRPSAIRTAKLLSASESFLLSVELVRNKPRLLAQAAFVFVLVCEAIRLRSLSITSSLVCASVGCRCAAAGPTAKVHALASAADLHRQLVNQSINQLNWPC